MRAPWDGARRVQLRRGQVASDTQKLETGFDVAASLRSIGFRYDLLRESDPDGDPWEQFSGRMSGLSRKRSTWQRFRTVSIPSLRRHEHDAFMWCSAEAAPKLLTWENNRRALVAAARCVAASGA